MVLLISLIDTARLNFLKMIMEVKRKNFFYFLPGLKPSEAKHGRQLH